MSSNEIQSTPWGSWEVLCDTPHYKVKRIVVQPGKRLSYQTHAKRQEHWMIVEGTAHVTLNGEILTRTAGTTVDIPTGAAHRIENKDKTSLVFIEIQTGTYFGEDDIVRLEDDYGRKSKST